METILKIIYDSSIHHKILNFKDIEKILELLVIEKCLNEYVLNIDFQLIRSNNLASYSNYTKKITIYTNTIDQMIKDIENNVLNVNEFETLLFKNLSILQILLHELEHANQQKISYSNNTLEALIIRLSYLVNDSYNENMYEFCPEERLAEIKSFEEINTLIDYINNKLILLPKIIEMEKLKRQLRGYHYKNNFVTVPIIEYFTLGNKKNLLEAFDLPNSVLDYTLDDRYKYGFPISNIEYGTSMKKLLLSLQKNFNNRINIK